VITTGRLSWRGRAEHADNLRWSALIGVVVLTGMALRVFHFAIPSLWGDEAFTAIVGRMSVASDLQIAANTGYPPLHYLLIHYGTRIFGDSEAALRLPSLLSGIALIPAIATAGTTLFDRRVGLLAAMFVASSPMLLQFAEEARVYSLLALFELGATWCLWRAVMTGHLRFWLGYAALMALVLYSHYSGALLLPAHALFCLLQCKRATMPMLRFAAAAVAILLIFTPWLPAFMHGPSAVGIQLGVHLEAYWSVLVSFVSGETIAGFGIRDTISGLVGVGLFALGLWAGVKDRRNPAIQIVLCTLLVPLALLAPVSGDQVLPRHVSFLLPVFALLTALGVRALQPLWVRMVPIAAMVAVLGFALPLFYEGHRPPAQDWRGLLTAMSKWDAASLVLVAPSFYLAEVQYYYRGRAAIQPLPGSWDLNTNVALTGRGQITPALLATYDNLLARPTHVAVIGANRGYVDPDGAIDQWLRLRGWRALPTTPLMESYLGLGVNEYTR
jgi:4-amino-4-deoxy-L-arabinose transferase-like glycosyltransferase